MAAKHCSQQGVTTLGDMPQQGMSRDVDRVQLVEHDTKVSTSNEANIISIGQSLEGEANHTSWGIGNRLCVCLKGPIKTHSSAK